MIIKTDNLKDFIYFARETGIDKMDIRVESQQVGQNEYRSILIFDFLNGVTMTKESDE